MDGQYAYFIKDRKISRYDFSKKTTSQLSTELKDFKYGMLSPIAHWWIFMVRFKNTRTLMV